MQKVITSEQKLECFTFIPHKYATVHIIYKCMITVQNCQKQMIKQDNRFITITNVHTKMNIIIMCVHKHIT